MRKLNAFSYTRRREERKGDRGTEHFWAGTASRYRNLAEEYRPTMVSLVIFKLLKGFLEGGW